MIRMCANLYLTFVLGRSFDRINLRKEKRGALKRLLHRICISNKDSQLPRTNVEEKKKEDFISFLCLFSLFPY